MVRRTWKAPPAMFPLSEQRGKQISRSCLQMLSTLSILPFYEERPGV